MTRRWHVEHADGSEWDTVEFDRLVLDVRVDGGEAPYPDACCEVVAVDMLGGLVIVDSYGCAWALCRDDDMEVVWE